MAEIVTLLGQRHVGVAPIKHDRAAGRNEQARDQPEQRGLARSVAADDGDSLAGSHLEIEPGKYLAAAAHAGDPASGQLHLDWYQPVHSRASGNLGVAHQNFWLATCSVLLWLWRRG